MNNLMFLHEEKRNEDLNSESLYEVQGKPGERIHLNELIQIDREKFECYD